MRPRASAAVGAAGKTTGQASTGARRETVLRVGVTETSPGMGPTVAGVRHEEAIAMAWDFETEPDYAAKLTWARTFLDEEILPLETLDLASDALPRAIRPSRRR